MIQLDKKLKEKKRFGAAPVGAAPFLQQGIVTALLSVGR